jgi:hypothetical protein
MQYETIGDFCGKFIDVQGLLNLWDNLESELEDAQSEFEDAQSELEDAQSNLHREQAKQGKEKVEQPTEECVQLLNKLLVESQGSLTRAREVLDQKNNEFKAIDKIRRQLVGRGDIQHRGDWFPSLLIREDCFEQHAQELHEASCTGDVKEWPYNCIDWELAATALKYDYSSVYINSETYFFRW